MTDYYISENDLQSYTDVFDDYTLEHHGILGQKWGRQMGPPYPLDASDHSAAEKKAGWRDSLEDAKSKVRSAADKLKESITGKKASTASETSKQAPPENETEEEKAAREKAERRAVIESANANTIAAHASKLTTQELQEAVNRMNLMAQVNSKITPEPTTMDKINNGIDKLDKAATTVTKGVDTYNKIAKIYNKFGDPPLPVLDKSLEERRKAAVDEAKKIKEEARKEAMNAALRTGDPDTILKAVRELKMDPSEIGNANKTFNNMNNLFSKSKEKAEAPKKEAEAKAKAEKEAKEKAEKAEIDRLEALDKNAKETAAQERSERISNAVKNRDFDYFAKNKDDLSAKEMKDAQDEIAAREKFQKYVNDNLPKSPAATTTQRSEQTRRTDDDRPWSGTVEKNENWDPGWTTKESRQRSGYYDPIDVDYEEVSSPYVPAVRNTSTSSFTSERRNNVVAALSSMQIDGRFLLEDKRR